METTGTYRPPTTIIISKHRVSFDVTHAKPGDEGMSKGLDAAQVLAKWSGKWGESDRRFEAGFRRERQKWLIAVIS